MDNIDNIEITNKQLNLLLYVFITAAALLV